MNKLEYSYEYSTVHSMPTEVCASPFLSAPLELEVTEYMSVQRAACRCVGHVLW